MPSFRIHSASTSSAHVSARRVCNYQVPSQLNQLYRICANVPFWMTARTMHQIATIRIMSTRPKRLADFLAFFASYQYVYNVTSFSFVQPPFIVPYAHPCCDTMSGGFCFSARLNLEKLLDYLISEVFLFEPADSLAIRVMPHAIRP